MAKVLITGVAGFIGGHLTDRLLARGDVVVGVDNFDPYYERSIKERNLSQAMASPNFSLVECDIRDRDALHSVFDAAAPEAVVHLAACAGVRPSFEDPDLYYAVNVIGTQHVLEACTQSGVGNLVIASSSSVYGSRESTPFHEDDVTSSPVSPYAATKKMTELISYVHHEAFGLPVSLIRIFTAYGPRQRPDMAIHKFARMICDGVPIPMFGDGSSRRDYTYVDDVVDGFVRAIDNPHPYAILNFGREDTTTLSELIQLIGECVGKTPIIDQQPKEQGYVPITAADVERARTLIGYSPQVDIREGVQRFVEWFLANYEGPSTD